MLVTPTSACTGEQPTFEQALDGATAIARVVVESVTEYGEAGVGETFRVVRILKGELPEVVHLDDPRTSICGDSIGYYAGEGREIVVAFGVPFYGSTLHSMWMQTDDAAHPIYASVSGTPGVATLHELEASIRGALPDAAMAAPPSPVPWTTVAGLVLILGAVRVRPTGGRRRGDAMDLLPPLRVDRAKTSALQSAHQCSIRGFTVSGHEAGE